MVSSMRIRQSRILESTISMAKATASVAASTSWGVTPGPSSLLPMRKASSPSTRGWRKRRASTSTRSPTPKKRLSQRLPKSGWSTPSCSCTALEVRPIFRPTTRSPFPRRRAFQASCTR